MVETRRAALSDEKDVAALIGELAVTIGVTREVEPVSWYGTLRKMLASPEWTFLLALEEGKKIGLLVLLILPSLYHGGNYAEITELIVTARHQRRGIGRMLVEEAKRIARSQGCEELDVSVEVQNEAAIGFYEKLDFEKKHADYWMKL
ncbi:MAG: GNAT family N-acetyltransferase [Actinomycetota bacterium]|nr:GNAT family N-acetyltransferase [Actinomycetota bacterium]